MSGKGLAQFARLLTERYETLKSQVARRLGSSSDMAGDVLHDAYVRLAGQDNLSEVRYPQSYLVNTAVHVAIDKIRSDARMLSAAEVGAFFDVEDSAPGPVQTAQARDELARMFKVLDSLPPRQCDILVSARVHDVSRIDLAKRWGISVRLVGRELQTAHEFCFRAMKELEEK
ncbi:ECF subfamily RNA polymerase sigma-24 factor [Pusillimonas sp. T7-7]|uniref:RNA polymerase sigma factor n=1 Tax=Pusillimonas sp. (strain T7-7) TaxID=1007105 RepID=UPI0002084AEC|nr:sigma-70 family RNA polymerase sigma factor [Pusillimonas sp. T7-7]AEC18806.1 ECF subfamily RNA polymerase sigma-24 factor [Pusillimonas sp. T7-7]